MKKTCFFTICSKNFMAYARTLYFSLKEQYQELDFYVALCDTLDGLDEQPFKIIEISELGIPDLDDMVHRYNITELNTAIKPFVFEYLFNNEDYQNVVYLDPDILVVSRLIELEKALEDGAEVVLTPHILKPAENVEVHDQKMLQFGIYNLGFIAFHNTADVRKIIEWWGRRLTRDCVIKLEDGLFVDQKWADLLPAFIKKTVILHHPGYNVAYWNLSQRNIKLINDHWYSNQHPLRFVHFSGNKLEDPFIFSRHSGTFNRNNIGDLKYLLDSYRDKIYENGHSIYSKLPYSFNWDGESGINLHTPNPAVLIDSSTVGNQNCDDQKQSTNVKAIEINKLDILEKIKTFWHIAKIASDRAGGWYLLPQKIIRVIKHGGIAALKHRLHIINSYNEIVNYPIKNNLYQSKTKSIKTKWVSRLLFIDWSTPRPDRDAGSLTAFHLLKIYVELGYDVTFIPSDLEYLGEYTEAVQNLGIRCLHLGDIASVKDHLEEEGEKYDFVLICRAPIAGLYIPDIRQYAPNAKIILNTSDLHYLRDIREAEIDGSEKKIKEAKQAKEWELNIIRSCDITIVMSSVELKILNNELPNSDVRLIPLMFVEPVHEYPSFENRSDILFIGGFPHSPNVDAVVYFCEKILPLIRKSLPNITFHIIGNAPPSQVIKLGELPGVIVHGYVKDVSQLFNIVKLSVAPLRYGAGIKGKIGTSLSYGVPVVATSVAVEGMEIEDGIHVLVADDPQKFASAITRIYQSKEIWMHLSKNGRDHMLQTYSPAAGHRRISKLMKDINPNHKQIDIYTIKSLPEYLSLKRIISSEINERVALERTLIKYEQPNFYIDGFCAICGCKSLFNTSFMYSYEKREDGRQIPNWREHLDCVKCGFINRVRAAMHIFNVWLNPSENSDIYITEQTTPLFRWLNERHPRIVGSEYLGNVVPLGAEKDGIRNEDMSALSFNDESFDYILSFDVMEHVSDDIVALREVYRCLKPGGTFLFAAPFAKDRSEKLIRAKMHGDGSIEHLLPPEYHGNPVDHENGALCFRYFAWDLIKDMEAIGFEEPKIINYWSRDFAYLGVEQFIFVGKKPTKKMD